MLLYVVKWIGRYGFVVRKQGNNHKNKNIKDMAMIKDRKLSYYAIIS
jgi:hypothetical protein